MKLKTKVITTIVTSLSAICIIASLILHHFAMDYIEKQELAFINDDYNRAFSMIGREETALESIVLDWSIWDDSYYFTLGVNEEFIDINLQESTLASLNLGFMLFIDSNGDKFYSIYHGLEPASEASFEMELISGIQSDVRYTGFEANRSPVTQICSISGKPVLISFSPITTSNESAKPHSALIIGRFLDEPFIDYLSEVLKKDIRIEPADKVEATASKLELTYVQGNRIWISKNDETMTSYIPIPNSHTEKQICLVFKTNRTLYGNWMKQISFYITMIIMIMSIIGVILMIGLERIICRPLKRLHRFMKEVERNKDTSARILLPGKDEIADLAASTSGMLRALDDSYKEMKIMQERFRLTMEATNDGFFDINFDKNESYYSPTLAEYELIDAGMQGIRKYLEGVYPEDREVVARTIRECLEQNNELVRLEFRAPLKSGGYRWIQVRGKIVEKDAQGIPTRLIGTLSDIQNQKNFEEENLYLSETDVVTTLKNRAYMEKILNNTKDGKVLWIIMGDVNGLKIINDSFGHQDGDRLLRAVGDIMKKCCSPDDIAARWGGDEFIVVVRDKDYNYTESLIKAIKKECDEISGFPIKISIALGCAERTKRNNDLNNVLKLAEERMYRHKLLESRSTRSAIIASLEQSLHERHIETEEHTKRIKQMCIEIGTIMNMSQDELDELALLGVLHDIGKIAIPESVLMKPGPLTPAEWEIMKTHSEIGYRIVATTPELAHIADEILSHHERFDGNGYPQGLKGNEIPKLSRLLTIVDSFDVMTHDRHYKKAMSFENAVQELKSCSGKQFDPEMVEVFIRIVENKSFFSEKGA